MSLQVCSINSGSNGNCYYIGNDQDAVLVDAGLSCRETEKRMNRLQLDMNRVRAIFISHEHSDHITGLPGLVKKYRLPVYINKRTYASLTVPLQQDQVIDLRENHQYVFGEIKVVAFSKFHDAADPFSFTITNGKVRVGVFTDLGRACSKLVHHFRSCHAAFLESNYCPEMLENGRYPQSLKERIRNGHGHLSNQQALELFKKHRGTHLSHLFLSHLSRNNNSMELVERIFTEEAGNTEIIIASRYKETAVYTIEAKESTVSSLNNLSYPLEQLRLF